MVENGLPCLTLSKKHLERMPSHTKVSFLVNEEVIHPTFDTFLGLPRQLLSLRTYLGIMHYWVMRGQCIPPLIRHTFFGTLCLFHKNTNASLHPLLWDDFKVDISSEAQNHMLKFLFFTLTLNLEWNIVELGRPRTSLVISVPISSSELSLDRARFQGRRAGYIRQIQTSIFYLISWQPPVPDSL